MLTTEELLIQRISNNIRGLKLGTKTIEQVKTDTENRLVRLRKTNPNMADELELNFYKEKVKVNELDT
jgi:hypothetical protein